MDAIIVAAKTRARAQDEERRAVSAKEPPALVPSAALGACPVSAKSLVPEDPESSDTNNGKRTLVAQRSTRVILMTDVWQNGKPDSPDGPAVRTTESVVDAQRLATKIGPSYTDASQVDAAIAQLEAALKKLDDGYDVTLMVSELTEPTPTSDGKFESGFIKGTAFLWSRAKHAVICGARTAAVNSDTVSVYGGGGWLKQNLVESAVVNSLPRLVVVGPAEPVAPATSSSARPRRPAR